MADELAEIGKELARLSEAQARRAEELRAIQADIESFRAKIAEQRRRTDEIAAAVLYLIDASDGVGGAP